MSEVGMIGDERRAALRCRGQAEEARAEAAEHRARCHDLRAEQPAPAGSDEDGDVEQRAAVERTLAEIEELHARALDERARAHEQRACAERERDRGGTDGEPARSRANMHAAWASMHDSRALALAARADSDADGVSRHSAQADRAQERALAAEQRVEAAEHRAQAAELRGAERDWGERQEGEPPDSEQRIHDRVARREARERQGLRRLRPGPGRAFSSPGMPAATERGDAGSAEALDHEIEAIAHALREHGPTERDELARLIGARYWGPGRFGPALREAVAEGRAHRLSRRTYGPPPDDRDDRDPTLGSGS